MDIEQLGARWWTARSALVKARLWETSDGRIVQYSTGMYCISFRQRLHNLEYAIGKQMLQEKKSFYAFQLWGWRMGYLHFEKISYFFFEEGAISPNVINRQLMD